MLQYVVIAIVVVVVGVIAMAASRPSVFRYQRTAVIDAPPEKIFPLINDFHRWTEWSPYENLDPNLKRSYSGAPSGKGAVYEYEGGPKVGAGRMEITESTPSSKVLASLEFLKPMKAHNTAEFTLQPEGGSTRVTWAMFGPSPFMSKLMGLFMNFDKMVGGSFADGLANLKRVAEAG